MELLTSLANGCKKRRVALLALLLFLLPGYCLPEARALEDRREYALKAAFLYNFCQFIEWPDSSFENATAPIIIGVLGTNPFGTLLLETVVDESIRGRRIQLEYYRRPAEAQKCHILFISQADEEQIPTVQALLRGRSILTVGESDRFLNLGGMIALTSEQNRVRLRVNLEAARVGNVKMSSKLLRVADIKR